MDEFKRKIKLLDHIVLEVIDQEKIPLVVSNQNFAEAHSRTVARLSQSAKSFEQIVKEILTDEGFDKEKIGKFHKGITLGVAHHSIEQHGNVTLCFENTSMLATNRYCENKRLAAYLEKSTRYQDFSKPCYIIPKEFDLPENKDLRKEYIETMDFLFKTYSIILPKIISRIEKELENKKITLDEKSIKKKAFDSARYILPASAYTNFAITTNSQVFRSLIVDLFSNNIIELNEIADEMQKELIKVYPTLLDMETCVINKDREKFKDNNKDINPISDNPNNKDNLKINDFVFENIENRVRILDHTNNSAKLVVYNYLVDMGFFVEYKDENIFLNNEKLSTERINGYLQEIFCFDCTGYRPHRSLELATYNFEGIIDFGAWRDLHRNRMLTWISSTISPEYGFSVPVFLEDCKEEYLLGLKKAYDFWTKLINKGFSKEFCQYVCPLATNAKILYTINARELDHVSKTRTTEHAHFSYRSFVSQCITEANKINPELIKYIKDYYQEPYSFK
ncbi:MAG: FAD-dependent thymidylate synthase [Candidatus ainarchaeum sp.]|nr:FAD-dependent thymidylate synthase [Candidatus ainarchaeum sp.]